MTEKNIKPGETEEISTDIKKLRGNTFRWYIAGVFLLGLVIGYVCGLSESPVVATLLPLLFGLISAGSGFYILKAQLNSKISILKLKLVAFSIIAISTSTFIGSVYGISLRTGVSLVDFIPFLSHRTKAEESTIAGNDVARNVSLIILRSKLEMAGATDPEIKAVMGLLSYNNKNNFYYRQKDSLLNTLITQLTDTRKNIDKLIFPVEKVGNPDEINELFEMQESMKKLNSKLVSIQPLIGFWRANNEDLDYSSQEMIDATLSVLNEMIIDQNNFTALCKKHNGDTKIFESLYSTLSQVNAISKLSLNDVTSFSGDLDNYIKMFKNNNANSESQIPRINIPRPTIKH